MRPCPWLASSAQAAIGAAARELKLPTVRDQAARLAEIAAREHSTYLAYLAEVLAAELDDRLGTDAVPAIPPVLLARGNRPLPLVTRRL
jgi:hypothetical protein